MRDNPSVAEPDKAVDHIVVSRIQPESPGNVAGAQSAKELCDPDRTQPSATSNAEAVDDAASSREEDDTVPNPAARDDLSDRSETAQLLLGWRQQNGQHSLPEAYSTVDVPSGKGQWFSKLGAFFGVGFMVAVGYMDPGNWATDLEGGSKYGYTLLVVILLANFMAMYLQGLALKLGIIGERDLAQACRDAYPKWACYGLWLVAEVAIAATDLAEIIGSATALYLLFNIPLWAGVLITAVDVIVILILGMSNFRVLEIIVFLLISLIFGVFVYELAVVNPDWSDVGKGFIPRPKIITNPNILYTAIGIIGATVMPHNLYLHSSIIQTRNYPRTVKGKWMAIKYGAADSTFSLGIAFFINAAILILAAAAFFYSPTKHGEVATLTDAYDLLAPAVGQKAAKILFAVALLAAGQNSSITGTLAGQIVMEGFINIRLKPWLRRAVTRGIAIIPAAIVSGVGGNAGSARLLVLSQVILSLALPFGVVPLVHFTSSKRKMGQFVNGWVIAIVGVLIAALITGLNGYLVVRTIIDGDFGSSPGAA